MSIAWTIQCSELYCALSGLSFENASTQASSLALVNLGWYLAPFQGFGNVHHVGRTLSSQQVNRHEFNPRRIFWCEPTLDLGESVILCEGQSHTLDAGPNWKSYSGQARPLRLVPDRRVSFSEAWSILAKNTVSKSSAGTSPVK